MVESADLWLSLIITEIKELNEDNLANVICFPLFGVLKAINVTKVDYFSLDVEGNEMDVLRTIPFDDVEITVKYCSLCQFHAGQW